MKIIPIGTKVKTIAGEISAIITAVSIRELNGAYVSYELSYFNNGAHTTCWLYRFEFVVDIVMKKPAGFHQPSGNNDEVLLLSNY